MLDDAVPVLIQCASKPDCVAFQDFTPDHYYHVSRRQSLPVAAKAFAKQPFQRVTLHRFWHLFAGNRETETRVVALLRADQDRQAGVAAAKIILKYLLKLCRARQSQPSWKGLADTFVHVRASGAPVPWLGEP